MRSNENGSARVAPSPPAAPSAGEEELPEIELTPPGASEEDIDLCGRKITLKHRFYGMGLLGGICVLFQAVALVPTVRWADIENETGGRRRKLQSCGSATFVAISSSECPSNSDLGNCYDSVACGELCEGDDECGTDGNLDNCAGYDVYRRDCPTSTDGKFVYVSQNMYWSDARSYCRTYHIDLASIHSSSENAEVNALCPNSCWIGGSDSASEGTFTWSDGTAWDFTNWNSDEPNNNGGSEKYLFFKANGRWNLSLIHI